MLLNYSGTRFLSTENGNYSMSWWIPSFNFQLWVSFFTPTDKAGYPVLYEKNNVLRYYNAQTSFAHTVILH